MVETPKLQRTPTTGRIQLGFMNMEDHPWAERISERARQTGSCRLSRRVCSERGTELPRTSEGSRTTRTNGTSCRSGSSGALGWRSRSGARQGTQKTEKSPVPQPPITPAAAGILCANTASIDSTNCLPAMISQADTKYRFYKSCQSVRRLCRLTLPDPPHLELVRF